jgi:hypothetical protein
MLNTITYAGQTFTRKGRKYDYAVVTWSTYSDTDAGRKPELLVEWASTLELAQKNNNAHHARAAKVAREGTLTGYAFSTDYYAKFVNSVIVPVTHS